MATARGAQGVEELRDAAAAVGLAAESAASDSGADLVLITPAGRRVLVQVKRVSLASADNLGPALVQRDTLQPPIMVLVADRVTKQARHRLRAAGWSWLDLRGHLHLAGSEFFIDA